jgi:hypothetical protein
MEWQFESDTLARLEGSARPLLSSLRIHESIDLEDLTRKLGLVIAVLLCEIFSDEEATRPYWIDDFLLERAELLEGVVRLTAVAWCGDRGRRRDQWQVPAEAVLRCSESTPTELLELTMRIGDASRGSLAGHRGVRPVTPDEWLHEFRAHRPAKDPQLDAVGLESGVQSWLEAHPLRPLVGPDWEPCDAAAARAYIRLRVARDEPVALEETWLDGGPALRVH